MHETQSTLRSPSQSYISKGIWRQGIGSFVRNSCVSTLGPLIICPYFVGDGGRVAREDRGRGLHEQQGATFVLLVVLVLLVFVLILLVVCVLLLLVLWWLTLHGICLPSTVSDHRALFVVSVACLLLGGDSFFSALSDHGAPFVVCVCVRVCICCLVGGLSFLWYSVRPRIPRIWAPLALERGALNHRARNRGSEKGGPGKLSLLGHLRVT